MTTTNNTPARAGGDGGGEVGRVLLAAGVAYTFDGQHWYRALYATGASWPAAHVDASTAALLTAFCEASDGEAAAQVRAVEWELIAHTQGDALALLPTSPQGMVEALAKAEARAARAEAAVRAADRLMAERLPKGEGRRYSEWRREHLQARGDAELRAVHVRAATPPQPPTA